MPIKSLAKLALVAILSSLLFPNISKLLSKYYIIYSKGRLI